MPNHGTTSAEDKELPTLPQPRRPSWLYEVPVTASTTQPTSDPPEEVNEFCPASEDESPNTESAPLSNGVLRLLSAGLLSRPPPGW